MTSTQHHMSQREDTNCSAPPAAFFLLLSRRLLNYTKSRPWYVPYLLVIVGDDQRREIDKDQTSDQPSSQPFSHCRIHSWCLRLRCQSARKDDVVALMVPRPRSIRPAEHLPSPAHRSLQLSRSGLRWFIDPGQARVSHNWKPGINTAQHHPNPWTWIQRRSPSVLPCPSRALVDGSSCSLLSFLFCKGPQILLFGFPEQLDSSA